MKRLLTRATLATILGVYLLGVTAPAAWAATTATPVPQTTSGQALEIAPPVITLTVDPGQTLNTQIFLRDVSPTNLIVAGEANDFVAAGEDGTPKILLKDSGPNPYSIKDWIQPPAKLLLASKEVKTMAITINVPKDASPGGHYGIVRFTATAPELNGTGVSLSASLGALLLITVKGKTTEKLSVASFTASRNGKQGSLFESTPLNFTVRLKNSGNVHEQPTAAATITDMFGKKVALVNFNEPPHNILPQSIRKFDSPLDSAVIGNKKLFGHYTAALKVTYGPGYKQTLTASLGFWVIPYHLIGIIIVTLIALFFALRYAIKRYNRMIVTKAQGNKK
jgi:hypothetical protein